MCTYLAVAEAGAERSIGQRGWSLAGDTANGVAVVFRARIADSNEGS